MSNVPITCTSDSHFMIYCYPVSWASSVTRFYHKVHNLLINCLLSAGLLFTPQQIPRRIRWERKIKQWQPFCPHALGKGGKGGKSQWLWVNDWNRKVPTSNTNTGHHGEHFKDDRQSVGLCWGRRHFQNGLQLDSLL